MKNKPRHCINVEFLMGDRHHIKDTMVVDGYTYKILSKKRRPTKTLVCYEIQKDVERKNKARKNEKGKREDHKR